MSGASDSARSERDAARAAGSRPPWSAFQAELSRAGFHPSKRLGQNFLLDENMVAAIARDSGVGPGARVLEVGTGCGFLTAHLVESGAAVTSFEIDRRLHEVASRLLGAASASRDARHGGGTDGVRPEDPGTGAELRTAGDLRLVRADVLGGKHALGAELEAELARWSGAPWHLVANLPYGVASPLLALLAARAEPPETLTVLVQREVALRLAAEPGSAAWGPLGVRLRLAYAVRILRTVPPQLFSPRPKVESAVARLERLPVERRVGDAERDRVDRLVGTLFQQRRKTLRAALGPRLGGSGPAAELLAGLGLDPLRRAETLTLEELAALARALPDGGG